MMKGYFLTEDELDRKERKAFNAGRESLVDLILDLLDDLYPDKDDGEHNHKDRSWLYQKRIVEGMTLEDMGKLVNRTEGTIRYWIKKLGVKIK